MVIAYLVQACDNLFQIIFCAEFERAQNEKTSFAGRN